MFCRLGSEDESRPVAVTAWLKDVWMQPVFPFVGSGEPEPVRGCGEFGYAPVAGGREVVHFVKDQEPEFVSQGFGVDVGGVVG